MGSQHEHQSAGAAQIRKNMAERDDLSPHIQAIMDGTYQPIVPIETYSQVFPIHRAYRAMEIWLDAKEDRNAALAVSISRVWKRMKHDRDVLGTYSPDSLPTEIADLAHIFTTVFTKHIREWEYENTPPRRDRSSTQTPENYAFDLLQAMINFRLRNLVDTRYESPKDLLESGDNTSSGVIWSVIQSIPYFAEDAGIQLTKYQADTLIAESYGPIVQPFASMHQNISPPLIGLLFDFKTHLCNPIYFHLEQRARGLQFVLDHDALMAIPDEYGNPILESRHRTPTTWCPARLATGDRKNVVREMFELLTSMARNNWRGYLELPDSA